MGSDVRVLSSRGFPGPFFERLARARRRALLLDYDGTLAPFRVERDRAVPYAGVESALREILASKGSRVAVISGRAAEEVARFLPGVEVWGSHGWERRSGDGRQWRMPLPGPVRRGLERAADWAESQCAAERVERKPAALALHWRGVDGTEARRLRDNAVRAWGPIAREAGLQIRDFDGGIELRPPGRDKGAAVEEVLREMGEGAAIAYLGDDETDEDAFRVLRGRGLAVLVRPEFRETLADLWIRPPEELLGFLGRWREACGRGS